MHDPTEEDVILAVMLMAARISDMDTIGLCQAALHGQVYGMIAISMAWARGWTLLTKAGPITPEAAIKLLAAGDVPGPAVFAILQDQAREDARQGVRDIVHGIGHTPRSAILAALDTTLPPPSAWSRGARH